MNPGEHCMIFREYDKSDPGLAFVYESGSPHNPEITWPVGRVTLTTVSMARLVLCRLPAIPIQVDSICDQ
jgi:hypothetical protein